MLELALALVLLALPVRAEEVIPGPIQAEVLSAYDGDTLTVRARTWLGQYVVTSVRVLGVDAPELRGKCAGEIAAAKEARKVTAALLGQTVLLTDIRPDKYGNRVLARVSVDGEDLADRLIRLRLGRPYGGERRTGWCG